MTAAGWPREVQSCRQVDLRQLALAVSVICDMAWKGRGARVYVDVARARAMLVVPGCASDERLQAACAPMLCGTYTVGVLDREVMADLLHMLGRPMPTGRAVPERMPCKPAVHLRGWTAAEDALLRRLYPSGGVARLQCEMDRSAASIRMRAYQLGVSAPGRRKRAVGAAS